MYLLHRRRFEARPEFHDLPQHLDQRVGLDGDGVERLRREGSLDRADPLAHPPEVVKHDGG